MRLSMETSSIKINVTNFKPCLKNMLKCLGLDDESTAVQDIIYARLTGDEKTAFIVQGFLFVCGFQEGLHRTCGVRTIVERRHGVSKAICTCNLSFWTDDIITFSWVSETAEKRGIKYTTPVSSEGRFFFFRLCSLAAADEWENPSKLLSFQKSQNCSKSVKANHMFCKLGEP